MKKIYLISGLGADERAFQHLDLRAYDVIYIAWIEALKKETLAHYAGRLLAQVSTKKPILIGLSFGGMIAIEMAKQIETEKGCFNFIRKNKERIASGF